jgi:dTDP-4-dehydrorhamnose reductase
VNVIVTGAAGQLGAATVPAWTHAGHTVTGLTRSDLDIARPQDVSRVIAGLRPDLIINCAADNRVDAAQADPLPPLAANSWAVGSLARAAADAGAVFVHYSTDFVFDGEATQPYSEEDAPNPRSVYGMTKLLGELLAADAPRHYVLRVESLFGGHTARSSIDRMWTTMASGKPAAAFSDRVVSPSFVEDVAKATQVLVERGAPAGVYHCVNSGHTTWFDVIDYMRRLGGFDDALLTPSLASETRFPAPRPMFAALSNRKLSDAGFEMPFWQDAITRYVSVLQRG